MKDFFLSLLNNVYNERLFFEFRENRLHQKELLTNSQMQG